VRHADLKLEARCVFYIHTRGKSSAPLGNGDEGPRLAVHYPSCANLVQFS
jgi:hypothetical protein